MTSNTRIDQPLSIEQICVYPIKGLRGLEVDRARVTPFGLAGDRRYMLVDATGRFLTQRQHPALTRFQVSIEGDGRASEEPEIRITDEQNRSLRIALEPDIQTPDRVEVTVWDDTVQAVQVSPEANAFFSDALGEDLRLVWMPKDADRYADPDFARKGDRVSFADGFPILVLGAASIDELNQRLARPVPINRFRANVIIAGSPAWAEDTWSEMERGDVRLDLVKPCARCVVITTDQESGERSKEPTATLATYRKRDGKVLVGMNAVAGPVGAYLETGGPLKVK